MKYIHYIICSLMLVTSCSKDDLTDGTIQDDSSMKIELSASHSTSMTTGSRIGATDNGDVSVGENAFDYYWEYGDEITVYHSKSTVTPVNFTMKKNALSADGKSTIFEGSVNCNGNDWSAETFTIAAFYPATLTTAYNASSVTFNIADQEVSNTLDPDNLLFAASTTWVGGEIDDEMTFSPFVSILKVTVKLPKDEDTGTQAFYNDSNVTFSISSPQLYTAGTYNGTTGVFTGSSVTDFLATYSGSWGESEFTFYLTVFPTASGTTLDEISILFIDNLDNLSNGLIKYTKTLSVDEGEGSIIEAGKVYDVTFEVDKAELEEGEDALVPIYIGTLDEFKALADVTESAGKYYELSQDIEITDAEWTPIGTRGAPFAGYLEGAGHKVYGMNINTMSITTTTDTGEGAVGLFGSIEGGSLKNLVVEGTIDITEDAKNEVHIGGVVGYASGAKTILESLTSYVTIDYTSDFVTTNVSNHRVNVGGVVGSLGTSSTDGYGANFTGDFVYGKEMESGNYIKVTAGNTINLGGVIGGVYYWTSGASYQGYLTVNASSVEGHLISSFYSSSATSGDSFPSSRVGGCVGYVDTANTNGIQCLGGKISEYCKLIHTTATPATTEGGVMINARVGSLLGFVVGKNGMRQESSIYNYTVVKGEILEGATGTSLYDVSGLAYSTSGNYHTYVSQVWVGSLCGSKNDVISGNGLTENKMTGTTDDGTYTTGTPGSSTEFDRGEYNVYTTYDYVNSDMYLNATLQAEN